MANSSQAPSRKNLILIGIIVVCAGVLSWMLWSSFSSDAPNENTALTKDPPPAVGGGSRAIPK